MRITPAALALLTALALPAAAQERADREAVAGLEAFALDLHRALAKGDANGCCSPYSVWAALAMTREGARGETAAQLDQVFGYPKDLTRAQEALRAGLKPRKVSLWDEQARKMVERPAYELQVANRLWGQEGTSFLPDYLVTLERRYQAPLERIDFRTQSELARKKINDWVAEQTRQRIKDIVRPPLPTPLTRLVLANAIFFKASWLEPFEPRATRAEPFFAPGKEVKAKLMHGQWHLAYVEDQGAQVLELPYLDRQTSMLVILPRQRDGLAALERTLTPARLAGWLKGMRRPDVQVALPRFTFTADANLTEVLPALGMPLAFDPAKADFQGISADKLWIGAVLHKAFIAVDEQGTEAAAATVVEMEGGAPPRPETPKVFRADHPFLFLIRQRQTGAILFTGRVVDPTKS
ncbi:MAG: serpin family protein [Planctomycetota bacterium]